MHGKLEVMDKVEEPSDDQQSDDLSLSIPLPPTPASVRERDPLHYLPMSRLARWQAGITILPTYFHRHNERFCW